MILKAPWVNTDIKKNKNHLISWNNLNVITIIAFTMKVVEFFVLNRMQIFLIYQYKPIASIIANYGLGFARTTFFFFLNIPDSLPPMKGFGQVPRHTSRGRDTASSSSSPKQWLQHIYFPQKWKIRNDTRWEKWKEAQEIKNTIMYKNHCCEREIYYCLVPHGLILYQHLNKSIGSLQTSSLPLNSRRLLQLKLYAG